MNQECKSHWIVVSPSCGKLEPVCFPHLVVLLRRVFELGRKRCGKAHRYVHQLPVLHPRVAALQGETVGLRHVRLDLSLRRQNWPWSPTLRTVWLSGWLTLTQCWRLVFSLGRRLRGRLQFASSQLFGRTIFFLLARLLSVRYAPVILRAKACKKQREATNTKKTKQKQPKTTNKHTTQKKTTAKQVPFAAGETGETGETKTTPSK